MNESLVAERCIHCDRLDLPCDQTCKKAMRVTIVGSDNHIHAAGCRDLRPSKYWNLGDAYTIEASTLRECIDALYGPDAGSFYEENGLTDEEGWRAYAPYFRVFPCAAALVGE